MKKYIRILTVSLCLLTAPLAANYLSLNWTIPTVQATTEVQDLNGFVDLYWDEPLVTVKATHRTKFVGYENDLPWYLIGIPNARGIAGFQGSVGVYGIFIENKLSIIAIPFSKSQLHKRLDILTQKWGEPLEDPDHTSYFWKGPSSTVIFIDGKKSPSIMIIPKNKTS